LNLDPATLTLKAGKAGEAGEVEELFVEMNESGDTLARISDRKSFEIPAQARAGVVVAGRFNGCRGLRGWRLWCGIRPAGAWDR